MSRPDHAPYHVFRFELYFDRVSADPAKGGSTTVDLCKGAFSEVTGLEATMEAKVIKEGGRNYGPAQRMGPITFSTVVLKRGMTFNRDLFRWFWTVGQGGYAMRMNVTLLMLDETGGLVLAWELTRALPVKFKAADLNARGSEVGIEELHLAHEGLKLLYP
ncbi:MAG TPA: phage tail protein [Longimicrobium sp.]|nr:phage tail protein [Longimicrobium sp.]